MHVVDVIGLSEDTLGYPRFPQELVARREWCTENCPSGFQIEPVRDAGMRLVGRRFVFASVVEAIHFKLRFDTSFR
jgi:hypothetical protein